MATSSVSRLPVKSASWLLGNRSLAPIGYDRPAARRQQAESGSPPGTPPNIQGSPAFHLARSLSRMSNRLAIPILTSLSVPSRQTRPDGSLVLARTNRAIVPPVSVGLKYRLQKAVPAGLSTGSRVQGTAEQPNFETRRGASTDALPTVPPYTVYPTLRLTVPPIADNRFTPRVGQAVANAAKADMRDRRNPGAQGRAAAFDAVARRAAPAWAPLPANPVRSPPGASALPTTQWEASPSDPASTESDAGLPELDQNEIHIDGQVLGQWVLSHLEQVLTRPPTTANFVTSHGIPTWPGQSPFV